MGNMGASVEDNLITACRKCNKTRGNMLYEDWLNSDYYKKVSAFRN
jgi:5-methylcytosine-specific restriction endonuclease McrA